MDQNHANVLVSMWLLEASCPLLSTLCPPLQDTSLPQALPGRVDRARRCRVRIWALTLSLPTGEQCPHILTSQNLLFPSAKGG